MNASTAMILEQRACPAESRARWRDGVMLGCVFLLLLSYIWIWQGSFRGAAGVFTIALVAALTLDHAQRGQSLRDAGFRLDTLPRAAALLAPVVAVAIASAVLVGHVAGSARHPSGLEAAASLTKGIAFGLAQQYVLLAFFYRGFERVLPSSVLSLAATAVVFSVFHLPNPFLVAVTFVTGFVAALVYRRAPNLWANSVAHGLIAHYLYYSLALDLTAGLRVGPGYWTN